MTSGTAELAARGTQPVWTVTVVTTTDDPGGDRRRLGDLDDGELVRASVDGLREAFDVLVERHQRAVYRLCFRFAGRHEDAADLTQEVFLRAFRGLPRFRGQAAVSTWLYRIGVNVCLSRVAARVPPLTSLDDAPPLRAAAEDPAGGLVLGERARRVRAAIARLPRKQRATLILRVYHDLSHREIADSLGTTVGAVKANFFHALGNLRRALGDMRSG